MRQGGGRGMEAGQRAKGGRVGGGMEAGQREAGWGGEMEAVQNEAGWGEGNGGRAEGGDNISEPYEKKRFTSAVGSQYTLPPSNIAT